MEIMKTPSLVLTNGTIIDGTGRARFRGDVAIRGNHIEAIDGGGALRGQSANEVDCSGLTIAPGFIDTHSHSDIRVMVEPALPMKVRQGITLEVFGQDGLSVAPVRLDDREQVERQLAGLDGRLGREWDWQTVAEYLSAVERAHPALD